MYLEFDCLNCKYEWVNITTIEKENAELYLKCTNCYALHKIIVGIGLVGLPLKEDYDGRRTLN